MSKHMPEVPIANRSRMGPGDRLEVVSDTAHDKRLHDLNTYKQGDAANIRQNKTDKGLFRGRRMK